MSKILTLSVQLQNQIAAGEVVERPASIVKELVENALDSGASAITVDIKKAGKEAVCVIDNGEGMDKDDLKKSVERYATSKLYKQEDLWDIGSFGFRGEALASIASVCELSIETRPKEGKKGYELRMSQGREPSISPVGCPEGTKVSVSNLFRGVPVRLKFLKGDATELHHIMDTLEHIILIHPHIDWTLIHNNKEVFHYTPVRCDNVILAFKEHVLRLLSIKQADRVYEILEQSPIMEIRGVVGAPTLARSSRKHQYIYVNGRPIKNPMVSSAVMSAFSSMLPHGKYPFFVLDIEITRDLVDVNVHPRKQEVRFINQQQVFLAVKVAVEKVIKKMDHINVAPDTGFPQTPSKTDGSQKNYLPSYSSMSRSSSAPFVPSINGLSGKNVQKHALAFSKELLRPVIEGARATCSFNQEHEEGAFQKEIQGDRIVGQMHNAYIVVEKEDGMLILDQHAVHERIRYEMLKKAHKNKSRVGQALLLPIEVSLVPKHATLYEEHVDFFTAIGIELKQKGAEQFDIVCVPPGFEENNFELIVKELFDDLLKVDQSPDAINEVYERAMLYLSCKKATKFGDKLSPLEMEYLYQEWNACEKKETCPHGRPLSFFIPFQDLDKRFDRS